jgi:hypothetical protein
VAYVEWLSAENVVAVGTAVIGVVSSAVMVWYERRVPRRKTVGYRVQMDRPIGDDVRSGRANVRLGLFDEVPGMSDATLVLLRIENDGSQSIAGDDYTDRPVLLVSRDANSGTRQVFQRRVLGRGEIADSSLQPGQRPGRHPHPRPSALRDAGRTEDLRSRVTLRQLGSSAARQLGTRAARDRYLGSGGRWRGMFGRVPGGSGIRPFRGEPSGRGAPADDDWIPSGAGPVRNSTIQSAVSVRTSSVTSSENRRSTPMHRSAASLAVPSAGPRTSRTLSDAQSN